MCVCVCWLLSSWLLIVGGCRSQLRALKRLREASCPQRLVSIHSVHFIYTSVSLSSALFPAGRLQEGINIDLYISACLKSRAFSPSVQTFLWKSRWREKYGVTGQGSGRHLYKSCNTSLASLLKQWCYTTHLTLCNSVHMIKSVYLRVSQCFKFNNDNNDDD